MQVMHKKWKEIQSVEKLKKMILSQENMFWKEKTCSGGYSETLRVLETLRVFLDRYFFKQRGKIPAGDYFSFAAFCRM